MKNTDLKSKAPPAETSNSARAKIDKKIVKRIKAPDTSKMFAIRTDHRTVYYFSTEAKRDSKIKQLKSEGIDHTVL